MQEILRRLFPTIIGAGRKLHDIGEDRRAIANQRPFLVSVAIACVLAGVFTPEVFTRPLFLAGVGLTVLSRLPSVFLSWTRFPTLIYWLVPVLQFAAIALLRAGGGTLLSGLGIIAVFPVIWLAWFATKPALVNTVNFIAPLTIVWLPVFLAHQELGPRTLAAPLMVPLVLMVVGMFSMNVSQSIDAQRDELVAKDQDLQEAVIQSEGRAKLLDAVIETVPAGVVVVDSQGHDLMMNSHQRALHQLGIPQDVPDPREDQLLVFDADRRTPVPPEMRPVRRAIDGHDFTHQMVWIGTECRGRALSVSATGMRDASGQSTGSVIVFNDVTELVDALEAKDTFLQGVTHELRTPLTSILGYVDLALEEAEASEASSTLHANLEVIERNAGRLLHRVSDLLSTATAPAVIKVRSNVADVVQSSVFSARPQAEATGIELVCDASSDLIGHFDPERMHQVLDNLISNAVKYSSAGDVVTAAARAAGDWLEITVSDTGPGISEADQQQLFDKFFRTASVRESTIPGLGLGLSITKGIVDAHQGTISIASALGQGTTFTVRIPAVPESPSR